MLESLAQNFLSGSPEPSFAESRAALALIEAMIPGSDTVPAGDETTLRVTEEILSAVSPALLPVFRSAQRALSAAAIASTGRPFYALDQRTQQDMLMRWAKNPVLRGPYSLVLLAYKLVHFDRLSVQKKLGAKLEVVRDIEQPRWLSQVRRGEELDPAETVECDVVVVGTGAGGAVVGRELAERGYAVAFVEEGDLFRRDAIDGSSIGAYRRFYRAGLVVGNAPMPIFMGRLVGGSTAINGGTCFRTPPWVLDRWCDTLRSDDFAPSAMARHFRRVEEFLEIGPTEDKYLGPVSKVFERGCRHLGWSYHRINRNAPGCQASGFCDYGCRTDARKSMNVSYVPAALSRSAMLFTRLRADHVRIENGRAVGLDAVTRTGDRIRFAARAVILAGGALPTPLLLQRQGICNRSGQVGRNLSIHPSGGMSGVFEENLDPENSVPQGFAVDQFLRQGMLYLGAMAPTNTVPMALTLGGHALMRAMEERDHIATVGTLIADENPQGTVRAEAGGQILVQYSLLPEDVRRLHQTMVYAGEMFLAAGAKRLYPACTSTPIVEKDDFARFAKARPAPSDLPILSYHPLGTCRMGPDPKSSVVDLDHQTHDVRRLFIVDGSTVTGPLGVNPQLTIMAVATRAAERIAQVLGD